jgi:hypothetical protein
MERAGYTRYTAGQHTLEADMEPTNWMRPRRTAEAYTKRVPPRSR